MHAKGGNDAGNEVVRENPKKLRGKVIEDLREIMNNPEFSDIIRWLPHGKAFKIFNQSQFVEKILPRCFKSKKFSYFNDILRCWGFVRLKKDKGVYYHKLFVQNNPRLTMNVPRDQMKKAMSDWPPGGKEEPDLYEDVVEMSSVHQTKKTRAPSDAKKRKSVSSSSHMSTATASANGDEGVAKKLRTRDNESFVEGAVAEV
jgi:hypothetical protein